MAEYLVNLTASGKASVAPFVDLGRTGTSPVTLGDGFSINYITGFVPEFETNTITDYTTSGDAVWVNQANVRTSGHRPPSGGSQILISGDPGASITVDIYSNGFSGRIVEWNLNGGAFVAQETDTLTETITLTGTLDGSGEAVLTFREASGSSGGPYSNALRITTAAAADTTPPTISSASVPTAGDTIAVQMSEAVQVGAGGPGGWTISLGDATISSAALDGTDNTIINLTPSRTLLSGESFTIGYTQPGDGFQDQAATPNDLATLSGAAVTNNSSQVAQVPGISAITVQKDGVAVQATDWEINIALNSDDSEVYSGTSIASNASGAISAINTTGGSVGDAVTVEGFSASNNYGFKFTQNLEDNA